MLSRHYLLDNGHHLLHLCVLGEECSGCVPARPVVAAVSPDDVLQTSDLTTGLCCYQAALRARSWAFDGPYAELLEATRSCQNTVHETSYGSSECLSCMVELLTGWQFAGDRAPQRYWGPHIVVTTHCYIHVVCCDKTRVRYISAAAAAQSRETYISQCSCHRDLNRSLTLQLHSLSRMRLESSCRGRAISIQLLLAQKMEEQLQTYRVKNT